MNFNRPRDIRARRDAEVRRAAALRVRTRGADGLLWSFGLVACRSAALASGGWSHYAQSREVVAIAQAEQGLWCRRCAWRPCSRAPRPNVVSLPATTSAFADANIFARASGYIAKREVDIGDHVKAGQLLAEIVAPELDHQISQAEAHA